MNPILGVNPFRLRLRLKDLVTVCFMIGAN